MIDTKYLSDKLDKFINEFVDTLPTIILSIFIFVIFYVIAQYYKSKTIKSRINLIDPSKSILKQELNFDNETSLYQESLPEPNTLDGNLVYYQMNWIIYYAIILFGLIISLVNLGFNVATIITLLGSVGLALGLAFQETLKNMISGVYIALNKLFKIGDEITLKPLGNINGTSGIIIDFNLYYTTIINQNKQISMIPNFIIQNNILTNVTISQNYFY